MSDWRVYTDASFMPGDHSAGAGMVFILDSKEIFHGFAPIEGATSSNSAELSCFVAAVETMNASAEPGDSIHFRTDSMFVVNAFNKPKDNQKPLIDRLKALLKDFTVQVSWHKGHANHPHNELADSLARAGVRLGKAREHIGKEDAEDSESDEDGRKLRASEVC